MKIQSWLKNLLSRDSTHIAGFFWSIEGILLLFIALVQLVLWLLN